MGKGLGERTFLKAIKVTKLVVYWKSQWCHAGSDSGKFLTAGLQRFGNAILDWVLDDFSHPDFLRTLSSAAFLVRSSELEVKALSL